MIIFEAKLSEIQAMGVKAYLHRQQLQIQLQQIQLQIAEVEGEMLKLDGEERLIKSLIEKSNE